MKDTNLFLNIDLNNVDLKKTKDELLKNGWFFKHIKVNNKIRLLVFLLEEDFEFFKEDPFYTVKSNSKDDAFFCFLRDTKEMCVAKYHK
jgi:hypothetical protein